MQQPPNPGQAGPPPPQQQFQPRGHHLHHGIHHHHTPPPTVSAATGVVVSQGGQPQNPNQGKIIYYNQDGTAPAGAIPTVFMPQPSYLYSHQIPRMPAQMPNQFFLYQTPGMAPFSAPIQQGYTQPPPNIPNQAQQLRPQTPPNPSASMGQHVIAANTAYIQTNPVAAAAPGGHPSMQPAAHPQPPPHLSQAGMPTSIQAQPMQPPTQQRVLERRVRQPLKIINPNTNEEVDPTASSEAAAASAAAAAPPPVVSVEEQPQEKARAVENVVAEVKVEATKHDAVVEVPVASIEKETPHEEKPISSSNNKPAMAPEGKKVEAAAPIIHPASSSNDKAAVESITEDQQDGKSKQKSKKDAKARRPSEAKEVPAAAVAAASVKEPVDEPPLPVAAKEEAKINNNVIKEPEVVPVVEAPKVTPEAPENNHVEGNHVADEAGVDGPATADDPAEAKEGSVENGTASTTSSNPASKSSSQIKLKYTYPDEQWSPINTEGKKQYDRNFLIELSKDPLSMRKPENLPSMDIIKDRPVHDKVYNAPQANQNKDWMPGFVKSTLSKSGMNTKGGSRDRSAKRPDRGGGGNMGGGGPPTVINIDRNFELHKTENAWKPVKLLEADVVELDPLQELERNVRAILNKLTPQKFDKLVKQFMDLTIDTQPKLEACIELIFEKAVDEPEFSVAYAKLCEVLRNKKVDNDAAAASREQIEGVTAATGDNDFRKLILTRCQREFERDYMEGFDKAKFEAELASAESEDKRKEMQLEFEEKERRARRRSLGNIRFIGELYKLKMLQDKTMHSIIFSLIKKIDEESLECLCWLLQTIGKDLEQSTLARMRGDDQRKNVTTPFDSYFSELENIIKSNKSLPSRVKFLLQDAVDLRRNNWKPRREKAGPKTLDQIHKEAEREKTQQQLLDMKPMGSVGGGGGNRGQDRDGGRKRSSRGPQQSNDDDWNTVPFSGRGSKNQSNSEKIDAQKIQSLASNRKDAENMSLGPGQRYWGKGSGSGAKPQNRFSAISGSSDENARRGGNFNSSASMGNFARGGRDRDGGSRGASMDERQAAIDSVRQFSTGMSSSNGPVKGGALGSSAHPAASLQQVAGGPSMSMDGSNLAHLPAPSTRDEAELRCEQTKQLKGPPDLDPDILKRRIKVVIDEYLFNCDLESAYNDVCSEFHPSMMRKVAEEWISIVLEKHEEEVKKMGNLLNFLVTKHVLLPRQFSEAVKSILEFASDLAIDIPKFWDFFGILIAGPLASGTALPLKFLQESAKFLVDEDETTKYIASVLKALVDELGPNKAGDLWKRSGLTLNQFMHPDKVPSFIAQNKLQFIDEQSDEKSLSDAELRKGLESILIDKDKPLKNDAVFAWIDSNVPNDAQTSPAFIRTLTRVVTQSSIKFSENCMTLNEHDFTERCQVLRRFVDAVTKREIQVLYALQLYMHELEHPTKMLHSIFHCLYNGDVISETAFFEWLEDKKVEQDLGRGVAVKSTTQFFTWLSEDQDAE